MSGTRAKTLHQFPGVPVAVPGSLTGSRLPNICSYMGTTTVGSASARGTCRSRVMAGSLACRCPSRQVLASGPGEGRWSVLRCVPVASVTNRRRATPRRSTAANSPGGPVRSSGRDVEDQGEEREQDVGVQDRPRVAGGGVVVADEVDDVADGSAAQEDR